MRSLAIAKNEPTQAGKSKPQRSPFAHWHSPLAGISLPEVNQTIVELHYALIENELEPLTDSVAASTFLLSALDGALVSESELSNIIDPRYPSIGLDQSITRVTEALGKQIFFNRGVIKDKDSILSNMAIDQSSLQQLATCSLTFEKHGADISELLDLISTKDIKTITSHCIYLGGEFTRLFNQLASKASQFEFNTVFGLDIHKDDEACSLSLDMNAAWLIDLSHLDQLPNDQYLKECVYRTLTEISNNLIPFQLPCDYLSEDSYIFEELVSDYTTIISKYGRMNNDKLYSLLQNDDEIELVFIDLDYEENALRQLSMASSIKNGCPSWMQLPEDYYNCDRIKTLADRIYIRRESNPTWGGDIIDTCIEVLSVIKSKPKLNDVMYADVDDTMPTGDACYAYFNDSSSDVTADLLEYTCTSGSYLNDNLFDESNPLILSPNVCEKMAFMALGVGYVERLQKQLNELG